MSAMTDKNYYEILGVSSDATTEEIRKAFQKKARTLHPDVNKAPDAEEKFKEVSEAYAVLSDEDKRRRYDAMRSGAPFMGSSTSSAPQSPFGGGFGGYGGMPFGGFGGFGGFGAQRGRATAYNPRSGADVVYDIELDSKTAATGTRRGITYDRYVVCDVCHGTGSEESEHAKVCPTCHGKGSIDVDLSAVFGGMGFGAMRVQCPECEGTGKVVADPCHRCKGTGRILSASEAVVDIPADSHDGDMIRVPGMGNAGTNGGKTGDLLVRVGIPAERLAPESAMGFQLIGFALPFIAMGLFFQVLGAVSLIIAVPLVMGLFMVARGGLAKHNSVWWKNTGNHVVAGLSNGFMLALFMTLMISCAQGAGRAAMRF